MFIHLLPHLIPLAAVSMLIGVTGAIVADGFIAFLSFSPTRFNWGTMLTFAMAFPGPSGLVDTPWNVLIAGGIAISLFTASFYLIAVGVQAATESSSRVVE
jgi:ABC-type dipeptide/oligopeptide/nickel transport system permease subunit